MNKTEKKKLAQELIMLQLSIIGYGDKYAEYAEKIGSQEEADKIMLEQMDRVAKMFGFDGAWFG